MPQVLAELAAKEWEALEVIKEDLCQWLANVLQLEHVNGRNFMDTLDTGVQLCKLAGLIQQGASEAEEKGVILRFKVSMEPLNCSHKASTSHTTSFYARDNAANFISWCRDLGVEEAVIFESEGLVLHKDEKRVILCLLDVARFAERVGIPPPRLVQMEREIEALEANSRDKDVVLDDVSKLKTQPNVSGKEGSPLSGSDDHHSMSPPPPKSDSNKAKKRPRPSRIPVRRSGRLENMTPKASLPVRRLGVVGDMTPKASLPVRRLGLIGDMTPTAIPVRRSGNMTRKAVVGNMTPKAVPVRSSAKGRKRRRSSDGEDSSVTEGEDSPAQKRTRIGENGETGRISRGGKTGGRKAGGGEDSESVKESVDDGVMRRILECTCKNQIEVTNCGNGKFIVLGASGRKMTTYARVSKLI